MLDAQALAMSGHNAEPSLEELLGDSAARLLMAADGVEEHTLRGLIGAVMQARQAIRD